MLCLSRSGLRYYWLGDKKANVYGEEVTEANKRIGKAYSKARALMSLGMKRDDAWRKAVLSITGREVPTGFYMAD